MSKSSSRDKLMSSIVGVSKERTGGGLRQEPAPAEPAAGQGEAMPSPVEAQPGDEQSSAPVPQDNASARTARVPVLFTPEEKKHLKRLAVDRDTNVSALVVEALRAKGYLPD